MDNFHKANNKTLLFLFHIDYKLSNKLIYTNVVKR